jgi:aminopeptidase N
MEILETTMNTKRMPTAKYPPSLPITIEKIWLRIEPDFSKKEINAEEQLKILAKQKIYDIELDVGELIEIKSVIFSTGADIDSTFDKRGLQSQIQNGKLNIQLPQPMNEGERVYLKINYIAKNSQIGHGLHFEGGNSAFPPHVWTLSESIYSRNWFICIDHPQVKFTKEFTVVVPAEFIVLANGELIIADQEIQAQDGTRKRKFVWEQSSPDSAYLSCIVIGKFVETSKGENYKGIPLRYYVPLGREVDARKTFDQTANMMKIFEDYLDVKYPYNKYSQVVVKGLKLAEADGMEHTSCTVLDIDDVLAEAATPPDKIRYDVVAHELAHQWFGDLVTCRDWQDIWLNEGFAAFFEALYFERSKGKKEYLEYIAKMTRKYIRATQNPGQITPIRAIVTNKYEHPDDMFDHNTYYKGGIVLQMLRENIGDDNFQKSLHRYLELFRFKSAETDDLRQIMEDVSGVNLQQFFDQWIYREGHPILDIKFSDDKGKVRIDLIQMQDNEAFNFPLDLQFILSENNAGNDNEVNSKTELIQISEKTFSKTFDISTEKFDHVIVDPEYKILKEFLQSDASDGFFINNLPNGNTIFSKVRYGHHFRVAPPHVRMALNAMNKVTPNNQTHIPVAGASKFVRKIENAKIDKQAHQELIKLLEESIDPKDRRTILDALGHFRNTDIFDLLKSIAENKGADPYERYFAAIAIGNTENKESLQFLKDLSNASSYHNLVARGSLEGLKIIDINSSNENLKEEIENFIIEKARTAKESRLKRTATSSLGYIARNQQDKSKIIDQLKELLSDESVYVRNSACVALANALEGTNNDDAINVLKKIAGEDTSPIVRATAMTCIDIIKDRFKEKDKFGFLGKETIMNSKYQSDKFDMLDEIEILS